MPREGLLLALSLTVALAYAGVGMVSPVRALYAQAHGASLAAIGAMATAYLLANFVAQYPSGWLADRWGRRRLIVVALLLEATISICYLVVSDTTAFIALRVLEGLVSAPVFPASRAMISEAMPPERQGRAFGTFGAAFNAGFLLGPPLGGFLAQVSYTGVFAGAAALRLVAVAIIVLLVHEPRGPALQERTVPAVVPSRALLAPALLGAYLLAFADWLWVGFDLALLPIWMHNQLGASLALIGVGTAAFALPTMLFSPLGGVLADRFRRSQLILLLGLGQVPLYITYGFLTVILPAIVLFVFHGAIYALMQPAMDAHLSAASPADARTRAQSLFSTAGLLGAFLSASGISLLYGVSPGLPLIVIGISYGLGMVVGAFLIRRAESSGRVPVGRQLWLGSI